MSGGMRRGAVVAALLVACHDRDATRSDTAATESASLPSSTPAPSPPSDAAPPPRCQLVTKGVPADLAFGTGAELGEAVPFAGGFAVGALRSADGGREASVLRVGGTTPPSQTDLGSSWGDAPPPQPFVHGEGLFVVAYVRTAGRRLPPSPAGERSTRMLSVRRVGASEAPIELPPESDGSAGYDVAPGTGSVGAVVVWDDLSRAGSAPPVSLIELATLSSDASALRGVRTLLATSDDGVPTGASDPRVVARSNGYWLTWVARRPERPVAPLPLPAGEIETPSEDPTFGWVEAISLDADGAPVGVARPLTPKTGHVGNYSVALHDGALLVVAEDEGATVRRGGGSLEQVVWRGEGGPELAHLVRGGVEEGTPPRVLEGDQGQLRLSYVDVQGDGALLPLTFGASAVRPSSTVEPLLGRGRVLGATPGHAGAWALAMQEANVWSLRWASCTAAPPSGTSKQ